MTALARLDRLALAIDPRAAIVRALVRRGGAPTFEFFRVHPPARPRPLGRPLVEARIALVTTAGLFHRPVDAPFLVSEPLGDPTFRWIARALARDEIAIAPGRFDAAAAERDLEVVHPERAMESLVQEGFLGALHDRSLSFYGHVIDAPALLWVTVPEAARELVTEGVDGALVVATGVLGGQTAAVVACALEAAGVASVVVAPWPALARAVGAPRVVAATGGFDSPMGPPGDPDAHRRRARGALRKLA